MMNLDRRFFIKSLGLLGGASFVQNVNANELELAETAFKFAALPYLQNLTEQHITICCVLSSPGIAWGDILKDDGTLSHKIYEVVDGIRNARAEVFKFKVPHQGADFKYRVGAKGPGGLEISSEVINTKLPIDNKSTCDVLILNDIHEDRSSYSYLYNKTALNHKDLVIINGDSFHYIMKQSDVTDKMLDPIAKAFASQVPFVMVKGNHDNRGSFIRHLKNYYDLPNNKFYQAFTVGPVLWIILDGGEDKEDEHEALRGEYEFDNYRLEQRAWLTGVMQSKMRKKAKHIIVVNHFPFFHSDEYHGTVHNRTSFHDILEKYKVDAVIGGHSHEFGFYPPDANHNYHVIIGGGPEKDNRTMIEVAAIDQKLVVNLRRENGELVNALQKG